jgi:GNAT superfamily N-acetyltransferase
MKQVDVTTTNLEMLDPDWHRPASPSELEIRKAPSATPELARFFYTAVGGNWFWLDRLSWSYDQWEAHLGRDDVAMWIGYEAGTPAGYFELEAQADDNVEIAYFGLLPQFVGRGHGGYLLSEAIRQAWARNAKRVWCHTCTLDGPHALRNYTSRGFKVFDRVDTVEELPDVPPGPWPSPG